MFLHAGSLIIGVSYAFARLIQESGEVHLGTAAERITEKKDLVTIETNKGTFKTKFLINCAGLHSDRIAKRQAY